MGDNYRLLDDPGPLYPDDPASVAPGLQGADPSLLATPPPPIPAGLSLAPSRGSTAGSLLPPVGLGDLSTLYRPSYQPLPPIRQSLKQEALTVGLPALVGGLASLFTHSTAPLSGALAGAAQGNEQWRAQEQQRQQLEAVRQERFEQRVEKARQDARELGKAQVDTMKQLNDMALNSDDASAFYRTPIAQQMARAVGLDPAQFSNQPTPGAEDKLREDAFKIYDERTKGLDALVKEGKLDPEKAQSFILTTTVKFRGKDRTLAEMGILGGVPNLGSVGVLKDPDPTSGAAFVNRAFQDYRDSHNGAEPEGPEREQIIAAAMQHQAKAKELPEVAHAREVANAKAASDIAYNNAMRQSMTDAASAGAPMTPPQWRAAAAVSNEYDRDSEPYTKRAAAYSDMEAFIKNPTSRPSQQAFLEAALHVIDPTRGNVTRANVEEIKQATNWQDRVQNALYQSMHGTVNLNTLEEIHQLANVAFKQANLEQQGRLDADARSLVARGVNPFLYLRPKAGPDVKFGFTDQDKWPAKWTDPWLHPERLSQNGGAPAPAAPALPTKETLPAQSNAAPNQALTPGRRVRMKDGSVRTVVSVAADGTPTFSR